MPSIAQAPRQAALRKVAALIVVALRRRLVLRRHRGYPCSMNHAIRWLERSHRRNPASRR